MTYPMMASKGRVLLWSAAFVLLWAASAHAADFSSHVVFIIDGNTFEVLNGHHADRIPERLGYPARDQRPNPSRNRASSSPRTEVL